MTKGDKVTVTIRGEQIPARFIHENKGRALVSIKKRGQPMTIYINSKKISKETK